MANPIKDLQPILINEVHRVMPTLRTGLVIAGGYADKVRRVLFAQMKDKIKSGEIEGGEVARATGELNRLLFEILVNKLGIDKGDVVRITVDYEVEGSTIKWKLDTLTVQAWRRIPEETVAKAVKETVASAHEFLAAPPSYEVNMLGVTDTGDYVFRVILNGEPVGAVLVTPINSKAILRAAVTAPTPKVLKKAILDLGGLEPEDYVSSRIGDIISQSEDAEKRLAERVIREILALIDVGSGEEPESE